MTGQAGQGRDKAGHCPALSRDGTGHPLIRVSRCPGRPTAESMSQELQEHNGGREKRLSVRPQKRINAYDPRYSAVPLRLRTVVFPGVYVHAVSP